MKIPLIGIISIFALLINACSKDKIPGVYRIDILQGNNITHSMFTQLKAGMSKIQVASIMGTPLLIGTFHPNRWDYIYSFQPGKGTYEQRRFTLLFNQKDILSHIGEVIPGW